MSLMIDIIVAILLISAIGYGMVLNRRIVALRRDQANLERLASSFHEATKRAEESVTKLKKTANSSSQILSEGIDAAARIREDLNFLVERGEKLGDRLEESVRSLEGSSASNKSNNKTKTILNPEGIGDEIHTPKNEKKLSMKFTDDSASLDAELLGNKIVKSEVEREFIKALRAVR